MLLIYQGIRVESLSLGSRKYGYNIAIAELHCAECFIANLLHMDCTFSALT
jgi:hypothetical protein